MPRWFKCSISILFAFLLTVGSLSEKVQPSNKREQKKTNNKNANEKIYYFVKENLVEQSIPMVKKLGKNLTCPFKLTKNQEPVSR